MKNFSPFKNEADCLQIGELTIENRVDRVSIFGSIDITLDKEGLAVAKELKATIDSTLAEMEKADLPAKISILTAEMMDNPFYIK